MDRRLYAVGIGVGQYIAKRDMIKEDIMEFFEKQFANDNCVGECPFVEKCNMVMALSNAEESLCIILGVCENIA